MKERLTKLLTTPVPVLADAAADRLRRRGNAVLLRVFQWRLQRRRELPDPAPLAAMNDAFELFAFPQRSELKAFLSLQQEEFPDSLPRAQARADGALQHRFELLGYGEIDAGRLIDWQRDFISRDGWTDVKVPWELSRFHHFSSLGRAYLATGNEDYAREFLAEVEDWLRANPPFRGVNWTSPMEAAIRAVNWIWAYHFFRFSPLFTAALKRRFADSLYAHGQFIARSLEYARRVVDRRMERENGNHYIADLVGLLFIGLFLSGARPRRWRALAVSELAAELEVQVLDDGAHWELSPAYHRLVLEMSLSALILCARNSVAVPPEAARRVRAMLSFTAGCLNADGTAPNVRDADEGRLHVLGGGAFRDHRHLLVVGACFFRSTEWLEPGMPYSEDALWLLGREGRDWYRRASPGPVARVSRAFQNAGFYALRDGRGVDAFVSCAGIGMRGREGSHAHNDCLSFELAVGGESLIVDSGTFIYGGDPALRHLFRSTASHNTARVDGEEMNETRAAALFRMENNARPQVTRWETSADFDLLAAEHYGYFRLPEPLVHGRQFLLDKRRGFLLVRDRFTGIGSHSIEVFLHLDPGATLELAGSELEIRKGNARVRARLLEAANWTLSAEEGWYSSSYGTRVPTRKVALRATKGLPCFLTMALLCVADTRRGERGEWREGTARGEWDASISSSAPERGER